MTGKFSGEVGGMCTQYRKLEKDCRESEEGLLSHPVLSRLRALEREKGQLEGMRVREEQGLAELLTWRQNLTDAVPGLKEDLVKKLEYMIGETVQFQMNEPGEGNARYGQPRFLFFYVNKSFVISMIEFTRSRVMSSQGYRYIVPVPDGCRRGFHRS